MARTLAAAVQLKGTGLHSGLPVSVRLIPQPRGYGICFIHTEFPNQEIQSCPANVEAVYLGTNLSHGNITIRTTEHLMASLYAIGITDLRVELSQNELPVMDGSALEYSNPLAKIGVVDLGTTLPLLITKPVFVEKDDSFLVALPFSGFKITYTVDYRPTIIGVQTFIFEQGKTDFLAEVAPARTFGNQNELETLHCQGLALGASLDNALGIDHDHYLNAVRFSDEAVRHKTLDLLGDLYHLRRPIQGHIIAYKSSHLINAELVKKLDCIFANE